MAEAPVGPCPECGSLRRDGIAFAGVAEGTGKANSVKKAVAEEADPEYHCGRLRPAARERWVGMSLTAEDGIERPRRVSIDRKGDWYEETVLNPDGSIRHCVAEPLHEHQGHGSAKLKIQAQPPDGDPK